MFLPNKTGCLVTPDILPFFCAGDNSLRASLKSSRTTGLSSDWRKRLKREPGYSGRLCLLRLHTIPVCSFELKPSFS
jgi:hypothetical protein